MRKTCAHCWCEVGWHSRFTAHTNINNNGHHPLFGLQPNIPPLDITQNAFAAICPPSAWIYLAHKWPFRHRYELEMSGQFGVDEMEPPWTKSMKWETVNWRQLNLDLRWNCLTCDAQASAAFDASKHLWIRFEFTAPWPWSTWVMGVFGVRFSFMCWS